MKKIIIPIALCSVIMTSKAYAATIDSVVVSDFENSILTVSGTAEPEEKGVSIVLLKKGQTLNPGMIYSKDSAVQFAEVNELKYNAEFQFLAEEGLYEVYAGNCDKVYEFEFIAKESVLNFVDELGKKAVAENEIFSKLQRYGTSVGVDVSFADSDSDRSYIAKAVFENSSKIQNNGIDGIKEIINQAKAELEFMDKLKTASVPSSVNNLLLGYSDSAKIDLSVYNGQLSDTEKTQVCLKFVEAQYNDMKKFREDFAKEITDVINGRKGGGSGSGSGSGNGGNGNRDVSSIVSGATGMTVGQQNIKQDTKLNDRFSDLGGVEWAWESILYVVERNIMNGSGEGKFEPNEPLTREQLAKIITLSFNMYDSTLVSDFADVGKDNWASSYVASAKANGLMMGIDADNFGCQMPVTRQDLCTVLYRAAQKCGIEFENKKTEFNDFDKIKDYSKDAVAFMAGSGIISGMGDGSFAPEQAATRAQAAKIISAVIGRRDR